MMTWRHRNIAEWVTAMRCREELHAITALSRTRPTEACRLSLRSPRAKFCIWGGRGGDLWIGSYCEQIVTDSARYTAERCMRDLASLSRAYGDKLAAMFRGELTYANSHTITVANPAGTYGTMLPARIWLEYTVDHRSRLARLWARIWGRP
jgi:hypothetical protein